MYQGYSAVLITAASAIICAGDRTPALKSADSPFVPPLIVGQENYTIPAYA